MRAMVFEKVGQPLMARDVAPPRPNDNEVLIRVAACAVCRTDLHIIDGELAQPKLPLILGHEIVGRVEAVGANVNTIQDRRSRRHSMARMDVRRMQILHNGPRKSLRSRALHRLHNRWRLRGIHCRRCAILFSYSRKYEDVAAAPLLCAGLIGYRSLPKNRGCEATRHLWFRRGGPHHCAGCAFRSVKSLHSRGRAISLDRSSRASSALPGLAARMKCHRKNWTPRSFLRRLERLFRPRCEPSTKADRWSAAEFT